jgi:hypothetical protein
MGNAPGSQTVKRVIAVLLFVLVAVGVVFFVKRDHKGEGKPAEEKPAEEPATRVTHDEAGRIVVKMDDETQGKLGLLVEKPAAAELPPELKGYGKVLDPAPLAALATELATAQAAAAASMKEFSRLKTLTGQGNAAEGKLQAAEAAARRDELAVQSAQDRLLLSWGPAVGDQTNLNAFIQPLTLQKAALVRIDLPAGETLNPRPKRARVAPLSGKFAEVSFLGTTANVDPQTLGRGAFFLMQPNELGLVSGEAITAFMELPGEPVSGVMIPSGAVVRPEGRAWIYIMDKGADAFTRTEVALNHPTSGGWLVTEGVTTNDYVVVTGAQMLLSEEMKSSLKPD